MDDAGGVGRGQAARHLRAVVDDQLARQRRRLLQPAAQRLALEQLHHQERRAVIGAERPDIVDGQDVRVIERACGPRLLLEPLLRDLSRPKACGSTLIAT